MNNKNRLIKVLVGGIIYATSFFVVFNSLALNISMFLVAYLIIGGDVVLKAIKNIVRGRVFDENFLMFIATIGAFAIGNYEEAVGVMLFYQIGELFQNYAVDHSRKSIASLNGNDECPYYDQHDNHMNLFRQNVPLQYPQDQELEG